jgi:hypothetical protein
VKVHDGLFGLILKPKSHFISVLRASSAMGAAA